MECLLEVSPHPLLDSWDGPHHLGARIGSRIFLVFVLEIPKYAANDLSLGTGDLSSRRCLLRRLLPCGLAWLLVDELDHPVNLAHRLLVLVFLHYQDNNLFLQHLEMLRVFDNIIVINGLIVEAQRRH